jgi:predicted RNA-binding Zn-ribbon protein involved in translation (DUF1610 family)
MKIQEWCPICEEEVTIDDEMKVQKCPNCGALIIPCSQCDHDKCNCNECKLDKFRVNLSNKSQRTI